MKFHHARLRNKGENLGVLTILMKTKTFTVLANQRALLLSRNAEKNLKSYNENNSVRN